MKFIASRISEGNKIFPAEIHCEENGLTVRIPGLFRGESQYFDYSQISSVRVDAPLIGYSTIHFYAGNAYVSAHGFTKSEVNEIKHIINDGKNGRFKGDDYESSADEIIRIKEWQREAKRLAVEEREQRERDKEEQRVREYEETKAWLLEQQQRTFEEQEPESTNDTAENEEEVFHEVIEIRVPEIGGTEKLYIGWTEEGKKVKKGEEIICAVTNHPTNTWISPIDGIVVGMVPTLGNLGRDSNNELIFPTLKPGEVMLKIIGDVRRNDEYEGE